MDVFDQNDNDVTLEDKDYLAELVGEDKKFKSPQDLAKGKAHADAHIARLEATLSQLRDELKTRTTTDQLMDQIKALKGSGTPEFTPTPQGQNEGADKGLTVQDVERLLAEREASRNKEANLNQAVNTLKEMYGDETPQMIQAKARELGVDTNYLKNLAKESPKIFTNLFQPKTQAAKDVFNAPPASRVNSFGVGNNTSKEKYSDFRKVQRENPNVFYSASFQRKIVEAVSRAQAQGRYDEFMNT